MTTEPETVRQEKTRMIRLVALGVVVVVLLGLVVYVGWIALWPARPVEAGSGPDGVAEIEAASGSVSVRLRSQAAWERGRMGMKLNEGDLIQTGSSGAVQLRFLHGASVSVPADTMFSIRNVKERLGKDTSPISLSAKAVSLPTSRPSQAPAPAEKPVSESSAKAGEPAPQGESAKAKTVVPPEPTLELERIIPFGRSLQVVGRVDPGNKLSINGEIVGVASDGKFKHFTKPFTTQGTVHLVLKTTDLAGRVRTVTREAVIN